MANSIQDKISSINYELDYRVRLLQHASRLPALEKRDRVIVDSLKTEGIYITSLAELGLNSSSKLLDAAYSLLPCMGTNNYSESEKNLPEICTVTELPE